MRSDEFVALPSEDREKLRQTALNSNYFMGKAILKYSKLVPHVHREPCEFFDNPPHRDIIHLGPRDHYKSTCDTIVDSCRLIARDPNIRILIRNEIEENAQLMLSSIKKHFMGNRLFRSMFPEIIPERFKRDTKWSVNQIEVPRSAAWAEPTVTAAGITTAVVSRHFDVIKFDDLVGMKAFNSPTLMAQARRELQYSISLLVEPEHSQRHISGTRWSHDDPYGYAIDTMGFYPLIQKAIVLNPETGKPEPLFPELISLQTLLDIMHQDPHQYATHYANDPYDSSDMDLQQNWLQYYKIAPDREFRYTDPADGMMHRANPAEMLIYTHVDPALGNEDHDQKKNDPYVDITVGLLPGPKIFVLDYLKKRITPVEQVERLIQVHETWQPEFFTVEHVGYQKALKYFLQAEARRRRLYIPVKDFKPPKNKTKIKRIRTRLQPYFSTMSVWIREDMVEFVQDYLKFGHTDDDHLLDALAQGPEFWQEPLGSGYVKKMNRLQQQAMGYGGGVTGYGT